MFQRLRQIKGPFDPADDLELLHEKLYPNQPWRVFGQSRGSAIAHYLLEKYPHSLESVSTQGYAMMNEANTLNYTYMRSQFNVRGSEKFAAKFTPRETLSSLWRNHYRCDFV